MGVDVFCMYFVGVIYIFVIAGLSCYEYGST